jgi:hypothetical protein
MILKAYSRLGEIGVMAVLVSRPAYYKQAYYFCKMAFGVTGGALSGTVRASP